MSLKVSCGINTVLREDYVGFSHKCICYTGINSCVTITGVFPGGLVGTHITVSTKPCQVDKLLKDMRIYGGNNIQDFYVVGALKVFKKRTNMTFINTRKKISEKIKSIINKKAKVRFYDSSDHGQVHVFAEKDSINTKFSWIHEQGNIVVGFNYPKFVGGTPINVNQFKIR